MNVYAPGKNTKCLSPDCDSVRISDVHGSELWNEQYGVFTGRQRCEDCGASLLYARRPTKQQMAMLYRESGPMRQAILFELSE